MNYSETEYFAKKFYLLPSVHLAEHNSPDMDLFLCSLLLTPIVWPWASRLQQREHGQVLHVTPHEILDVYIFMYVFIYILSILYIYIYIIYLYLLCILYISMYNIYYIFIYTLYITYLYIHCAFIYIIYIIYLYIEYMYYTYFF